MPILIIPIFPPRIVSPKPQIPKNIEIGDIIVARYEKSRVKKFFWEDWHHAAIVSKLNPLTIIEAVGKNNKQPTGPFEVSFGKSVCFGESGSNLIKIKWLRPAFPDPIREINKKEVKRSERKIISEEEARKRAVEYARKQIGEPYDINANKWDENKWYCSLLVFKAYSRSVTDMYLEDYNNPDDWRAGPRVTPEDLADSKCSEVYYTWVRGEMKEIQPNII